LPIYTYACAACGNEIERRQSFSDPALTTCETCGGSLRKVLHPVGVIFKGSGFYNTDYKKSTNGGGGSDKPADSKPADNTASDGGAAKASESSTAAASPAASTSTETASAATS
jgi:putative FmdB family regulatory protein